MAIEVAWGNPEKTIILQTYDGKWTWDEFFQASEVETGHLMDSVTHTVDVITDYTDSVSMPSSATLRFGRIYNLPIFRHENAGKLILVGPNYLIQVMVDLFQRMYPDTNIQIFTVNTIEEAHGLLEEISW